MAWAAWTDGERIRFLKTPEDEDLTGWSELALPDGFDPDAGGWQVVGQAIVADVAAAKVALKRQVRALRDQRESAGCVTPFGTIDTDPDSQRKISGACTAAMILGAGFSKQWRMADDSQPVLSAEQMITVGLLVVAHVDACQTRKNQIDAAIDTATSSEELASIDINAGWPA